MNFKIIKYDGRYLVFQMLEYSTNKFLDETFGQQYGARFSRSYDNTQELIKNAYPVNYYSFSGIQHRIKETELILDFSCDSWELIKETIENNFPEILI